MRLLPSLVLLGMLFGVSLCGVFPPSSIPALAADDNSFRAFLPLVHQGSHAATDFALLGQVGGNFDVIEVHGNYAYLGNDTRVTILDVSDPTKPREVGRSPLLPETIDSLFATSNAVFAETARGHVYHIDVQTPTAPVVSGPINPSIIAHDIVATDTHLYLTDKRGGLHVFALDAPDGPTLITSLTIDATEQPSLIYLAGTYAYIFRTGISLSVLDMSIPADPVLRDTLALDYGIIDAVEHEGYLYLATGLQGLRVIDVRDPTAIQEISNTFIDMFATMIGVANDHIYIVGSDNINFGQTSYMAIFDVSIPGSPRYETKFRGLSNVKSMDTAGSKVLLAFNQGMVIIDATDPEALVEEGQYIRADTFRADYAQVQGRYVYLTGSGNLYVISITAHTAERMRVLSLLPTECTARDLKVRGDYAYLFCDSSGLHSINIADPLNPVYVSKYTPGGIVNAFDIAGNYAYLSSNEDDLAILDISNPAVPVVVGRYTELVGTMNDVWAFGRYVLIVDGNTFYVMDVSKPAEPREVAMTTLSDQVLGLEVAGTYAFARGWGGFIIIDLSDPLHPREIAAVELPDSVKDIVLDGSYLYANNGHQHGLRVFDISQPAAPRQIRTVPLPGFPQDITLSGSHLYIASSGAGLIQIKAPTSPD